MTTMSKILGLNDRERFLAPMQIRRELVPLPELGEGCSVWVHGMNALEWTAFQTEQQGKNGKPNDKAKRVRERMVVHCCRDESGLPLFSPADVPAIGKQPAGMVERIVDTALRLSGLASAEVETIAKNSDGTSEG